MFHLPALVFVPDFSPLFAVLAPHLALVTPIFVLHTTVFLTIAAVVVVVRARNIAAAQPQKCRCQNRWDGCRGLHGCSFSSFV
jgi:hypothetical protein